MPRLTAVAVGVAAAILLAVFAAAPTDALAAVAPTPAPTATPVVSLPQPLSPAQQALAASLARADSQLDTLQAEIAQNQQQQTAVEARISAESAQVQQLDTQITALDKRIARLTVETRQERAQLADLARVIEAQPSSTLFSVVEADSLGDFLTQTTTLDSAARQASLMVQRIDSNRRRAERSRLASVQKQATATAAEKQAQTSQAHLQTLAAQMQTRQAQLLKQTSSTRSEIAAADQAGGSVSGAPAVQLAQLGTGGLDEQTLNAGLASGLYTLSTSAIKWPQEPDPSPLGLAQYPGYCVFTPIQCTCYAASAYQKYTGGTLPDDLGNGGQWINGAEAAGIPTSQTPAEGSVVVFSGPGYSALGHVAFVRSVIYAGRTAIGLVVWERNMDEQGSFDVRVVALGPGSQIAGYIPPGH